MIRWRGIYKGVETTWLRWATLAGELLLLPEEFEKQQAQLAQQRVRLVEQQLVAETQRSQIAEQRAQTAETEIARLKALLAAKSK